MQVTITINCDNATFGETECEKSNEIIRILRTQIIPEFGFHLPDSVGHLTITE